MLKSFFKSSRRHHYSLNRFFSDTKHGFRFCVVGAGPAGFHMTKQILKDIPDSYVDIYDQMPFPFGLVRYGVAPDHQEVKNVTREFTQVGAHPNIRFFGNVEIGKDIALKEIRDKYTAVIFSYGAQGDKKLGLHGEDTLKGVYSARAVVNWYNVHPDHLNLFEQLSSEHEMKNMIIIGNGNVAVDVARIFGKNNEELQATDINEDVLKLKASNPVENIIIVGRRGCVQAAFTTKTLRELTTLKDVECYVYKDDIEASLNEQSAKELKGDRDEMDVRVRQNRRKFDVLKKLTVIQTPEEMQQILSTKPKGRRIIFRFMMNPIEIIGKEGKISRVVFQKNFLEGTMFKQNCVADLTKEPESIDCDILLRSIGYQADPMPEIHFDYRNSIIPNSYGCVIAEENHQNVEVGLYVTGWIKTGPIGVLDTTLKDSVESFINVKNHFLKGFLKMKPDPIGDITKILESKHVKWVDFKDWAKVDSYERTLGQNTGKVREKIRSVEEFFKIAQNAE